MAVALEAESVDVSMDEVDCACVVRTGTPSAGSVNEKPNLAAMAVAFDVKSDAAMMVGDNDGDSG